MADDQPIESMDDLINQVGLNSYLSREQLIKAAAEAGAPEHVRAQVESLPEGEYRPKDIQETMRTGVGPQDESSDS